MIGYEYDNNVINPVCKGICLIELHVLVDEGEVELPIILAAVCLVHILCEDAPPLWAGYMLLEELIQLLARLLYVEVSELIDVSLQFPVGLVEAHVHGRVVDSHHSRRSLGVVAAGCQGDLTTVAVATECSTCDLVFPHVPEDVSCYLLHIEGFIPIRVTKVPR